jgi:4-amino-4-deoxy-L-arabinose transferase-like glycosyltransferase
VRRLSRFVDRLAQLRESWWFFYLGLAAIVPRALWAAALWSRQARYDEVGYLQVAASLCAGRGYLNQFFRVDDFWPIGYPALLSGTACGDFHRAVLLQIVIGTATCVVAAIIATRLFGPRIGRLAALTVALYPNHVFYSTLSLTEPMATLLLLGIVGLMVWEVRERIWAAAGAGVLMSVLILTRPGFVLFAIALGAWYWQRIRNKRRALAVCGVLAATTLMGVAPWIERNHRVLGVWETSSNGGYAFLVGNGGDAFGGYRADRSQPVAQQIFQDGRFDAALGYRLGWDNIKRAPMRALRRLPQKISYLVAFETDGVLWNFKGLASRPPLLVVLMALLCANAVYLFVGSGALLALTRPQWATDFTTLIALIAACLAAASMIFLGDPRYHYLLMPFAAMLFARALLTDAPELRSRWRRRDPDAGRWLKRWAAANVVWGGLMLLNLYLKYLELR